MKKVVLSLAVVAAMFVSCKETAADAENTIDSTATVVEETVETIEEEIKIEVKPKVEKTEKEKRSGNLLDFFRKFFEDDTE